MNHPRTVKVLAYLCLFLSCYMTYVIVMTSLESNLFEAWSQLAGQPWMRATLIDFYINVLFLSTIPLWLEPTWLSRLLWLVLFLGLGAIATAFYFFLKLYRLPPGSHFGNLFDHPPRPHA